MDTFNNTSEYSELIERYKLIAENTVECIWLFDLANRRFKYISPSILNLRGITVEEAMKEKIEDCITPKSFEKVKDQCIRRVPKFLSGDRSENIESSIDEYEQYCKDGTIKNVEISTKLIINKETKSVDILGVSRDVSHRKKLNNKNELELENIHRPLEVGKGRIYCFGRFLVYGCNSNSLIKWRTHKSEELFAYLLQNREQLISKWKICEELWPQYNLDKINNILHTSLYKMKKALELANIKFHIKFINGCYRFSIEDVYIDTVEFDTIVSSNITINGNNVEKYDSAFSLYKNHYLEENDFYWSVAQKEIYSLKYYQLGKNLIDYYMNIKCYVKAGKVINNILKMYPLDEFANEVCLKLYYLKKDRIAFINQYKLTQRLFETELGIQLNLHMRELYKVVVNKF